MPNILNHGNGLEQVLGEYQDHHTRSIPMIDTYIKFIKAHETILGIVLAAFVIYGSVSTVEDRLASRDNLQFKQAVIVSDNQAKADAAVAAQVAADKAALDRIGRANRKRGEHHEK